MSGWCKKGQNADINTSGTSEHTLPSEAHLIEYVSLRRYVIPIAQHGRTVESMHVSFPLLTHSPRPRCGHPPSPYSAHLHAYYPHWIVRFRIIHTWWALVHTCCVKSPGCCEISDRCWCLHTCCVRMYTCVMCIACGIIEHKSDFTKDKKTSARAQTCRQNVRKSRCRLSIMIYALRSSPTTTTCRITAFLRVRNFIYLLEIIYSTTQYNSHSLNPPALQKRRRCFQRSWQYRQCSVCYPREFI